MRPYTFNYSFACMQCIVITSYVGYVGFNIVTHRSSAGALPRLPTQGHTLSEEGEGVALLHKVQVPVLHEGQRPRQHSSLRGLLQVQETLSPRQRRLSQGLPTSSRLKQRITIVPVKQKQWKNNEQTTLKQQSSGQFLVLVTVIYNLNMPPNFSVMF